MKGNKRVSMAVLQVRGTIAIFTGVVNGLPQRQGLQALGLVLGVWGGGGGEDGGKGWKRRVGRKRLTGRPLVPSPPTFRLREGNSDRCKQLCGTPIYVHAACVG